MPKEDAIEVIATVVEPLPNAMVELDNKHQCLPIFQKMQKISFAFFRAIKWPLNCRPTTSREVELFTVISRLDL